MDRVLYLAMSGASQTMLAQSINTNNLANATTTGFKADLAQARSMPVFGDGMPTRVYAMTERPGVDFTPGAIGSTGRELDVAIQGEGWMAVQADDGSEAYTRAGDLRISSAGLLVTGSGRAVLGEGGTPIAIPPAEKLEIGVDGTISIRPVGQGPEVLAQVDRIKLVNPPEVTLYKGEDGLVRVIGGGEAAADAGVRLASGMLEHSNVSAVESMVSLMELQRQFEIQTKLMKTAQENDSVSTGMMKLA